jgi:tetratricopeptide (TPR) repeat protein
MEVQKIIKLLNKVINKNIAWTYSKGYHWYAEILLPSVKYATHNQLLGNKDLSDVWYEIGDIHFFNNALKEANVAYKKSISFDKTNAASYREIGSNLYFMSQYKKAKKYTQKAILLNKEDENAISDLEMIVSCIESINEADYEKINIHWLLKELLAKQKFNQIITICKDAKDIENLKILARAYGALNNCKDFFEVWKTIFLQNKEVEIEGADWYYMPSKIYRSSDIWIWLLKYYKNISNKSWFDSYNSFEDNYPTIKSAKKKKIYCQFKIAKINKDKIALQKLLQKYPKWKELQILVNK